jgi:two-component system chemotaxis response regulator CheY
MPFNILIVDDSPAMRRVVRRVVDLSGFEVGKYLEAGDGLQALTVLRSEWVSSSQPIRAPHVSRA